MTFRTYRWIDTPLSRRVKTAMVRAGYGSAKAFEEAASLPRFALGTFLRTHERQSPERRRLVMQAIETHLALPVAEIATLAGIAADGGQLTPVAAAGDILGLLLSRGDITARQAEAGRLLRTAAGGLSFPGLRPCKAMWKAPLRAAWSALEAADTISRLHRGCPPASLTAWRIVVEADEPGWLSSEADPELSLLERHALTTGLDALAAHLVPAEPPAPPRNAEAPVQGVDKSPPPPPPEPEPLVDKPPPAPRAVKTIKTGKRGRPTKETALALRVRSRMETMGIPTITALEQRAGLPAEGFRGILRGQVGRNKALKLHTIERVASVLKIPPAELAELAGLVEMDRRRIDHGTAELQMRRQALAAGGDPRLCGTALGVLLAHEQVEGRMGISQVQHDVGQRFADLVARPMPGAPRRPRSFLDKLACPSGAPDANLDAMALQTDIARLAWRALVAGDREATHGPRPSVMVWRVAVQGILPQWAAPLAAGPWHYNDRLEWLALRQGLHVLRRHFGLNEDHRTIVGALNELREGATA